jgi:hypothetical protein
MKRAIGTRKAQNANFDTDFLKKHYVVNAKSKIKSILHNLLFDPIWIILFLIVMAYPKIELLFSDIQDNGAWEIVTTTKLKNKTLK